MKITLQDPVVVSQAPPDLRGWGPWQFPLLHRLEDGRLLVEFHREADSATAYGLPQVANGRTIVRRFQAMLTESVDQGYTWQVKSVIPYSPDQDADPAWDGRDGFTEPQIGYLPDGSLLCLLRTTDGNGVGPLYSCRSTDGGASWSRPRVFDDLGVWPQLLTLGCGVTLAVYGRPGLYLRASADPAGQHWQTRLTLRQPGALGRDTCSYADLISLGKNEALLVYSDFEFPDPQDRPCKTILTRRIAVGG